MGDNYCESHEVGIESIAYDHCPYCRMEADQHAMEVERAQRHAPRSVDDPAPIESYRR